LATVPGLLHGWPLARINASANQVAAFVCSHHGATPELPARFRR
jgi:sugar/nucleoside kinase (ribokinase family)